MKIVHIIPYFYPAWAYGGTCRAAWELARALVRKGQSVVVYTTDALDENSRSTPASVVVDGVEIHRVRNISNHLAWRRAFLPLGFGSKFQESLHDADVVHLHEFRSFQNAVALPYMVRTGVPFVLTAQGGLPRIMGRNTLKVIYDRNFGARILSKAARLHALNELEREQFIDLGVDHRGLQYCQMVWILTNINLSHLFKDFELVLTYLKEFLSYYFWHALIK